MTLASHSRRNALLGALAALLLLPVALPRAETLNSLAEQKPGSRLSAYFNGSEQGNDLYAIGRHWDKKLGLKDCKGPYNIQPVSVFLLKPIDFPDGKLHPVTGSWQHRFVFERCGKRMTYNAVFIAKNGEKPEAKPHYPGTTNASTQQISEALKTAYPAAKLRQAKRAKNCQEAELIDTRLTQPPRAPSADSKIPSSWEEAWTFRGCGHDLELPITFTPDGKGGTHYAIKGAP